MEPLRLCFEIQCPAEHAFEIWTTRLSSWWPKGHSASGNPDTVVVFEPRPQGRIFERTPDGTEIDWARSRCGVRRTASAISGTSPVTAPMPPTSS
jgi:hypothetical protein